MSETTAIPIREAKRVLTHSFDRTGEVVQTMRRLLRDAMLEIAVDESTRLHG